MKRVKNLRLRNIIFSITIALSLTGCYKHIPKNYIGNEFVKDNKIMTKFNIFIKNDVCPSCGYKILAQRHKWSDEISIVYDSSFYHVNNYMLGTSKYIAISTDRVSRSFILPDDGHVLTFSDDYGIYKTISITSNNIDSIEYYIATKHPE
jgi:hypothetical protein